MYFSLRQQAGSDSRTNFAVNQVHVGVTPSAAFAKSQKVHVIVYPHGCVKTLLEGGSDIESIPAWHVWWRHGLAASEVDRAGKPYNYTPDWLFRTLLQHLIHERHHHLESLLGPARNVPNTVYVLQNVTIQGSNPYPDVKYSQRTDNNEPSFSMEAKRSRVAAA